MFDFITIGGTTRDVSFFTDQGVLVSNSSDILRQNLLGFESGSKIKVDKFYYSYGGGAANAAACLANFGWKIACLAPVGDDRNGELIIANLASHNIDNILIQVIKHEESGSSFILIAPSGERIIFAQRGANSGLAISERDIEYLKRTKNIYIASLAGDWLGNLRKIFSVVKDGNINIFWNPGMTQLLGGADMIKKYLQKTTVLSCNKDEAIALVLNSKCCSHIDHDTLNNTESLIRIIHSFGPKIVVITLGSEGVYVFDGHRVIQHDIIKEEKRVDTTGVGDIFNSSFAAGWVLFKGDIDKALHLSLQNAAAKVGHIGAQASLIKIR